MEISEGFLLSYIKYGDHNAVLHVFTRENGYQSFFCRGIYNPKNKTKAYLIPLNHIQFRIIKGHQLGSLETISQLVTIANKDFSQDIKASTIVFFVSDLLNQLLRNENQSALLFLAIEDFLQHLENGDYKSHLTLMFEILQIQGLEPLDSEEKFLNPETGKFEAFQSHHLFDESVSKLWKDIALAEDPYSIEISPKLRRQFLSSLLVYYYYHYAEFRQPQSLEIVQQIFE